MKALVIKMTSFFWLLFLFKLQKLLIYQFQFYDRSSISQSFWFLKIIFTLAFNFTMLSWILIFYLIKIFRVYLFYLLFYLTYTNLSFKSSIFYTKSLYFYRLKLIKILLLFHIVILWSRKYSNCLSLNHIVFQLSECWNISIF